MKSMLRITLTLTVAAGWGSTTFAQSTSLGADIVSRYVWRGVDFGQSASIQPSLSIAGGGLEVGTWASYSISADGASANEHDVWVSYSFDLGSAGSLTLGVTDYYFPKPDTLRWSNFEGDGNGSHWIEPYVSFTSSGAFPFSIFGGVFAHNDPDKSIYLEVSAPPTMIGGVEMGLTAGAVTGKSEYYGVDKASLVNLGISASKEIPISDGGFGLPISVLYILNPTASRSFLVFGLSLSI